LKDSNAWWRVSIDGGEFRRFHPQGKHTMLAENLPQGEHKVLLVRSTEGRAGVSEFRGFYIDDDAQILPPDPMKKRRLEFIGDSITAGFKNDGSSDGAYQDIEDNDMAFGPQLARMLDADYSVLAKSGEGVVHNWGEDWPNNQVHTADRYGWILYSDKKSPENKAWNPQDFPVDGIIIALGTNDFNRSDKKRKPTHEGFVDGYEHLLQTVRQMNPDIPIICTEPVPSAIPSYVGEWINEAVTAQKEKGDNNIYYIAINEGRPLLEPSDYAGDNTHPLKSGAKKIALFLKDKVASILRW
jgi:lysophospholipase L1-like esterase